MVRVIWQTTGGATHDEQLRLRLKPGQAVIRAAKIRYDDDGKPFCYDLVSVPTHLLPQTDGSSDLRDIHELAGANRLKLGNAIEAKTSVPADRIAAKHLGIKAGDLVSRIEERCANRVARGLLQERSG